MTPPFADCVGIWAHSNAPKHVLFNVTIQEHTHTFQLEILSLNLSIICQIVPGNVKDVSHFASLMSPHKRRPSSHHV